MKISIPQAPMDIWPGAEMGDLTQCKGHHWYIIFFFPKKKKIMY